MIIRILPTKNEASSKEFSGVNYNDNKVEKGTGELMEMKNFPAHINSSSTQKEVVNYFKAISKNNRMEKPQFHCVISTENRNHSKTELAEIADRVMQKMGYESNPYIIVYHSDTDNNHVHIVSTRVNKENGKKIDDSFEKLKSQTALKEVLKELYGTDQTKNLENLLKYKFSNENQFEKLLSTYGFNVRKDEQTYKIAYNGLLLSEIKSDTLNFSQEVDKKRAIQISSILNKYKEVYSNIAFGVEDKNKNITYHSELQQQLKIKFGIEIVFSQKNNMTPFGYTIIDNKNKEIFKGSEVLKMGNLFSFSDEKIDKTVFDVSNNYNVSGKETKQVLIEHLQKTYDCKIKDFMVFENKNKVPYILYDDAKNTAVNYIRNYDTLKDVEKAITIVEHENKFYVIHNKENKIYDLQKLVGDHYYNEFTTKNNQDYNSVGLQSTEQNSVFHSESNNPKELLSLSSAFDSQSSGAGEEEEQKNKRKKKRR